MMLDVDNFKFVSDTYAPTGRHGPKHVANVLHDSSREADTPARYGGEEMALILPHADLDGSCAIAVRVRSAIEGLRIPCADNQRELRITASLGVEASLDCDSEPPITDADAALYSAKRAGKNRSVRAQSRVTTAVSGE